ncbi:MAG: hypothetical protein HQL26_00605 [Candidatus Omnitrophica bacterium]|nr:hypothetical protein [Candidatus Omnitrophota bacterium]
MDLEKLWEKALKNTEIIRSRIQGMSALADTRVPYILLSESEVDQHDTVIRKGELIVQKPSLVIPPFNPQFNGFEFEKDLSVNQNSFVNFLIVRGISMPSFLYDNQAGSLDICEISLSKAIKDQLTALQQKEDVMTGLIAGPSDCWQMSLIIFICTQILRNTETDFRHLLEQYRKSDRGDKGKID